MKSWVRHHVSGRRAPGTLLLVTTLVGAVGCSGFERAWKEVADAVPASDPVTGRWQGRWYSETAEHGDRLRCIITRREDGTYDAWFHAYYMKVLAGEYHAALVLTDHGSHAQLTAEADLGWLAGGVYRQAGRIQDGRYTTRYWSKKDRGTFAMQQLVP